MADGGIGQEEGVLPTGRFTFGPVGHHHRSTDSSIAARTATSAPTGNQAPPWPRRPLPSSSSTRVVLAVRRESAPQWGCARPGRRRRRRRKRPRGAAGSSVRGEGRVGGFGRRGSHRSPPRGSRHRSADRVVALINGQLQGQVDVSARSTAQRPRCWIPRSPVTIPCSVAEGDAAPRHRHPSIDRGAAQANHQRGVRALHVHGQLDRDVPGTIGARCLDRTRSRSP